MSVNSTVASARSTPGPLRTPVRNSSISSSARSAESEAHHQRSLPGNGLKVASGNAFAAILDRLSLTEAIKNKITRTTPPDVIVRIVQGKGNDIGLVGTRPGQLARDSVEGYACARVGYHRGLDRLRQSGWRGSGYVRWEHETNRGFLRALDGLRQRAGEIGEADEEARCAEFLLQLEPGWNRIDPVEVAAEVQP